MKETNIKLLLFELDMSRCKHAMFRYFVIPLTL